MSKPKSPIEVPSRLDESRDHAIVRAANFQGFEQDGHLYDKNGNLLRELPPDHADPPAKSRPMPRRIEPKEGLATGLSPEQRAMVIETIATRARNTASVDEDANNHVQLEELPPVDTHVGRFPRSDVEALLVRLDVDNEAVTSALDEIEALVTLCHRNEEADRQLPRASARKASLKRLEESINGLEAALKESRVLLAGTDGFELLSTAVNRAGPWRNHVLLPMIAGKLSVSPRNRIHREWLIKELARILKEITEMGPTFGKSRDTGGYTGSLFDLVWLCLPEESDAAIGKAIEMALKRSHIDG